MKFKIFVKSIIGKLKKQNQDYFVIEKNKHDQILVAIADGVGFFKESNLASKFSCEVLKQEFLKINFSDFSEDEIIFWGKIIIKNKILDKLLKFNFEIATTLTFLIIINNYLYIFHVGNDRFFQLKQENKKLFQITNDHNLKIDKNNFFNFMKEKEFLSNSFSSKSDCYVDFYKLISYPGQYLLITDGVHDFVKNKNIENILNNEKLNLNKKIELIYENSIFNGSLDDITIILFEIN